MSWVARFDNLPPTRRLAFTIVELVVVVLIIGILAAVAVMAVTGTSTDAHVATIQRSLTVIQDQVDLYFSEHGEHASTIDPEWFQGNKLPHHPLNDGSIPDVHVFASDDREHPRHKTLDQYGAYWYNRNIGIVRARVPIYGNDAETLAFYNRVNRSSLTSLGQKFD